MSYAPSKQALRYLARLCHSSSINNSITASSVCRRARAIPGQHSPIRRGQIISLRSFSCSVASKVQPSTSNPESDPQNNVTNSVPDITSFYTLFSSTLPYGAPTGPELAQSASSTPTEPPASHAKFEIHVPTLRKEFLHLQSLHHPDKYPTGTAAHKQSLALSSLINNAYKTLSDPLLRAQYLLDTQHGIDVTSEDNSAHPTDQETLMEVMEAQERIEEAKEQNEIDEIQSENKARIRDTERKAAEAFEKGDVEAAKNETIRMKYWRSLQDGLNDWEPGKEVRLIH